MHMQLHDNIMPLTTPVISEPTGMDGLGWWEEWSGKGMLTSSICMWKVMASFFIEHSRAR